MRVDGFEAQGVAREEFRQCSAQVIVSKPEAIHPGIDLQMVPDRFLVPSRGALHGAHGGRRRNRRRQRELEEPIEVADAQRAEHQNGRAHAGAAQHDRLLDVGAREQIRARRFERERHALGSMAIGVGLDHGDHPGHGAARTFWIRGARFEKFLYRLEVGLQRRQVNVRDGASDYAPHCPFLKKTPDPI